MDALVRPLVGLYGLSNGILATGIADLSEQDAKTRSRGGTGPSVAWTIGHLCHFRDRGSGPPGPRARERLRLDVRKRPGSDGTDYPSLAELAATFSRLSTELNAALESASARLDAQMPDAGLHNGKRVLDTVLFFAWHEAYHIGSIGAIRKELGRKAIADLVEGVSDDRGR